MKALRILMNLIKEAVENREVMSFPIKKTNEFENLL